MTTFDDLSVVDALERSIRNAKHLRARDSAAIAAARKLARKIDAWDVIVEFALDDALAAGGRPSVPQNDNVSLASFLKYLESLGLLTPFEAAASPSRGLHAVPTPQSGLQKFRRPARTG